MACNTRFNLIDSLENDGILVDGKIENLAEFDSKMNSYQVLAISKYGMPGNMEILKGIKTTTRNIGRADGYGRKSTVTISRPQWNMEYFSMLDEKVDTYSEEAFNVQREDAQRAGIDTNERYLFDSRNTTREENPNGAIPLGDNYVEYIRYKEESISKLTAELNRQKNKLKNAKLGSGADVVSINKTIKSLENQVSTINRQLDSLHQQDAKYMFHAIEEDLVNLEQALESDDLIDINKVNNTIKFYNDFVAGRQTGDPLSRYDNELYNEILGKLQTLEDTAYSKILEASRSAIENSIEIQRLKENDENLDLDSLFNAQKDLNWMETWFLGVTSDRTSNTVIPQAMQRLFRSTLSKKQATVEGWNKELRQLVDENPELQNPDFIREKDEDGNETGYIINLFTPKYYGAIRYYENAVSEFIENPSEENYKKTIDELRKNNSIIDFTRIQAVQDVYGNVYSQYFNSTQEEIDRYEESLRKGLGNRYEEVVDQILNRLALFEEKVSDSINSENDYATRDLAAQDIWQFNEVMKSPNKYSKMKYQLDDSTYGVYFRDFSNLVFLPKEKRTKEVMTNQGPAVQTTDTGYYNQEYRRAMEDPAKREYWELVRNITEYVNSTYDIRTMGRLPYPKVQKEYAERVQEAWKDKNFKSLFHDTAHEYKSWFYEKGRYKTSRDEVIANYGDSFESQVSELAKSYILNNVDKDLAYTLARGEILDTYSTDFNTDLIAAAMEASLHDARLETQPMAQAHLEHFKTIRSSVEDGVPEERKNAIRKLEHFYEKLILNVNEGYTGSKKVEGKSLSEGTWLNRFLNLMEKVPFIERFITNKSTSLLSESEKKVFEGLKAVQEKGTTSADYTFTYDGVEYIQKDGYTYEAIGEDIQEIDKKLFDEALVSHIEEKISNLGVDLNLAGIINGILKTVIFKGLAINPVSGIFNRIEGKHSSMIMDATGEYWTTGNIDVANNLMAFANINKLSKGRLSILGQNRKKQLQIFETLVKQFNILQDRKNELQRSAEEASFTRELMNPFIWAVENPEFKNQGAIIMAIMMDKQVTDVDGNVVPLLDKNTGEFTIYNFEEGKLTLKDEYRTPENIASYENFNSSDTEQMILQMVDSVSRSQGNYDSLDIMLAKKSVWGRAATLFMTWFPEHINQRFGISGEGNVNLATGKGRRHGRFIEAYRANKVNTTIAAATALTVSYGIGGPLLAAAGVGGLGFLAYKKFVGKIAGPAQTRKDINYAMELLEFTKSLLVESLNYPGRLLNVPSKLRIKNNSFEGTNMTENDIAAMRAMTRELAVVLTWLSLKLAMGALLYDDDDDKESPQRMRYNFLQNQLSRSINALTIYTNPQELVSDHSRVAALEVISTAGKVVMAIWNEKQQEDLGKNFLDLTPIPRIITKGQLPFHDKMNYDELSSFSGIPAPLKWTSDFYKNLDTGGEYEAEKRYKDLRKEKREELKEDILSRNKGKKEATKKELDAAMKEIFGKKGKDQTYKEYLEEIELKLKGK